MKLLLEQLKQIEQLHQIKILHACETGSRAWGFPSPDSDYDVRFVYMHHKDWYLYLGDRKDTIEVMDGDLDVTGWDLRKSLRLLKKSNAALIERFQSPMQYYNEPEFIKDFKNLVTSYYSPTAVFYHHYSLAKKLWDELEHLQEYKLKAWFYMVRSLMSCNWIIKDEGVPPMEIEGLMKYVKEDVKSELRRLIKLKSFESEKYIHKRESGLQQWITTLWQDVENAKHTLKVNNKDYRLLNEVFIKTLDGKANDRVDKS